MKTLFLSAAGFNWVIALLFGLNVEAVFLFFNISPLPSELLFVHFFSAVVFSYGIGYYWIAKDFETNQPIVKLGAVAKLILVGVGMLDCLLGIISWQIMVLLLVDFVYSLLFFGAYQHKRLVCDS